MLELMCLDVGGCAWTRRIVKERGGIIPFSFWISLPKEQILLKTVAESSGKPLEMQLLIALCKMSFVAVEDASVH